MVPSTKSSPVKSPLSSPEASTSSASTSPVSNSKASASLEGQSEHLSEQIKPATIEEESKTSIDSEEDDKPLSSRLRMKPKPQTKTSSPVSGKRPLDEANVSEQSSVKRPKVPDSSASAKNKKLLSAEKEAKEEEDDDFITIADRAKKVRSDNKSSVALTKPKKVTKVVHLQSRKRSRRTKKVRSILNKRRSLSPEQEEVATMYAVMKDTEYVQKKTFRNNFWNDWQKLLGKRHVIQKLDACDFTPVYDWYQNEKEKKKQLSKEDKKALQEEKLKQEKYMWAIVDGVKEKVRNFRVEPPGLFRGRGEHPKVV
ncbi:unnamed protein product [Prunus armeniaca]|uniref:DNA topoisomerase I DNA binding eukaryotic-type domain-containing protein n=1 Tax=Prunus armeniaca TaxID=36596 RepID=A0A6J5TG41_PRUAR|nr:unnamed protein product [Prunus armeniaca]